MSEAQAFIAPPAKPFWLYRLLVWLAERVAGQSLLPARLLLWYPPAAFSSGVLEALIADGRHDLNPRLLQLVRLQTSFAVACPFCIAMNSVEVMGVPLTPEELTALRGQTPLEAVPTFSEQERLALQYTRLITQTPLKFYPDFIARLKQHFTEREIVILATTAAQVNYWARLIQALGIPTP